MANANLEKIQGVNVVVYARKLAEAAKVAGQLIPYQTSLNIDPQRDSDKKKTKSGTVTTTSSLETDFKFEFVNNWSKIADQLLDSIFDNEEMEFWAVNRHARMRTVSTMHCICGARLPKTATTTTRTMFRAVKRLSRLTMVQFVAG